MYVLKCVKPGYYNFDLTANIFDYATGNGGTTRSLNRAEIFQTRQDARRSRSFITNNGRTWINPPKKKDSARFEIVPVTISLKE